MLSQFIFTDIKFIMVVKNKKTEIVKIAMRLFAKNGYHKTTTAAISKEAGISTGLLFYHFSNKEKLLDAVIKLILSKLNHILKDTTCSSPNGELECIIDRFFNSLKEDVQFWDLHMTLIYQPDTKDRLLDRVIENSRKFRRTIYELLKEMGSKNPSDDSYEFELLRVGIFTAYLSNRDEKSLEKSHNLLKTKYITNFN